MNKAPQAAFSEAPQARIVQCYHQGDHVEFVIHEWEGGGRIAITGSYTPMSTHGFSFGKGRSFADFLSKCSRQYMMNKLLSGDTQEPDWEESVKALKRTLLTRRREEGREADAAAEERQERGLFGRAFPHYSATNPGLTKEEARNWWNDFFGPVARWESDEEIFMRAIREAPEYVFGSDAYEHGQDRVKAWIPHWWENYWLPFIEYLQANPQPQAKPVPQTVNAGTAAVAAGAQ